MKVEDFTQCWFAVTIDQQRSRTGPDRVAGLLQVLPEVLGGRARLHPERTAGDEVQLLTGDAAAVVDVVGWLQREGGWWTGLGIGPVDAPLPASTREARGGAYLAAREAVESAKASPVGLVLRGHGTVGGAQYRVPQQHAADAAAQDAVTRAESALWLLCELWLLWLECELWPANVNLWSSLKISNNDFDLPPSWNGAMGLAVLSSGMKPAASSDGMRSSSGKGISAPDSSFSRYG